MILLGKRPYRIPIPGLRQSVADPALVHRRAHCLRAFIDSTDSYRRDADDIGDGADDACGAYGSTSPDHGREMRLALCYSSCWRIPLLKEQLARAKTERTQIPIS